MFEHRMHSQLDAEIQSATYIALAVDISADVSDNVRFLVYDRSYHGERKDFCQNNLGMQIL